MQCVRVVAGVGELQWKDWLCVGRFYSLCVSPFSLSPLTSLCSASTPFHPPELREGWCALSFLLLLLCFRKLHLMKQREAKKKKKHF